MWNRKKIIELNSWLHSNFLISYQEALVIKKEDKMKIRKKECRHEKINITPTCRAARHLCLILKNVCPSVRHTLCVLANRSVLPAKTVKNNVRRLRMKKRINQRKVRKIWNTWEEKTVFKSIHRLD